MKRSTLSVGYICKYASISAIEIGFSDENPIVRLTDKE
jgi:hypothetical protein